MFFLIVVDRKEIQRRNQLGKVTETVQHRTLLYSKTRRLKEPVNSTSSEKQYVLALDSYVRATTSPSSMH
jgi:hypothetical protein